MHTYAFAFLLYSLSLFSCQQNTGNTPSAQANLAFDAIAVSQKTQEKDLPLATEIIFQSTDGGQTWQDVSAGLPKGLGVGRVLSDAGEVVLVTGHSLYHSSTASKTPIWEKEFFADQEITDIFPGKTGPYLSCYENGFFKKLPSTDILIPMHQALKDKTVRTVLETPDGTLFVGCESGLFKSVDEGKTWKQVLADIGINSLVASEGVIISGTYDGLVRSTDGGEHWDKVLTEGLSAWNIKQIAGGFVCITDGGSWKDGDRSNRLRISTDQGKTWQRIDENFVLLPFMLDAEDDVPNELRIYDIEQAGKYLFCSTNAGIFRSSDQGKSWEFVPIPADMKMPQLAVSGNMIYIVKVRGC